MPASKKLTLYQAEQLLKKKTILYSLWDCESRTGWTRYQFAMPLKKTFGEVITFDPRKKRFDYGPERMKEMFLNVIGDKKPDYVLLMVGSDEMNIDTLEEIKLISPETKTIALLTDEDTEFEVFSRYYALFVDYCMVTQPKYLSLYEKDKLSNGLPMVGLNLDLFKPLNLEKKYDLSFVGQQYPPRVELMKHLISQGIRVNVWGPGWLNYPEFREHIKGGAIGVEKYIEVMNQSKIILGLIKNKYGNPHISHRPFEAGACKAFQLLDYAPGYWPYLKKDKEVVMFRDKHDLIKKIKYYLKNESKREKIAENCYKKIIKNYDITLTLKEFFKKILENKARRKFLPKLNKKIIEITTQENLSLNMLSQKLKDVDYVSFKQGNTEPHKYKNYLQMYSLEKTGRDISCCDYTINSERLGDYLVFKSYRYLRFTQKENFSKLLNLNQIIVKKEYFLNSLNKFKAIFEGNEIDFIKKDNTAFVSIPLVRIKNLNSINKNLQKLNKSSMDKAFQINFIFRIFSIIHRKKMFDTYPYKVLVYSISKQNSYIAKYLLNSIFNKENWARLKNIAGSYK